MIFFARGQSSWTMLLHDMEEGWETGLAVLALFVKEGSFVRSLGVSNFYDEDFKRILFSPLGQQGRMFPNPGKGPRGKDGVIGSKWAFAKFREIRKIAGGDFAAVGMTDIWSLTYPPVVVVQNR